VLTVRQEVADGLGFRPHARLWDQLNSRALKKEGSEHRKDWCPYDADRASASF